MKKQKPTDEEMYLPSNQTEYSLAAWLYPEGPVGVKFGQTLSQALAQTLRINIANKQLERGTALCQFAYLLDSRLQSASPDVIEGFFESLNNLYILPDYTTVMPTPVVPVPKTTMSREEAWAMLVRIGLARENPYAPLTGVDLDKYHQKVFEVLDMYDQSLAEKDKKLTELECELGAVRQLTVELQKSLHGLVGVNEVVNGLHKKVEELQVAMTTKFIVIDNSLQPPRF